MSLSPIPLFERTHKATRASRSAKGKRARRAGRRRNDLADVDQSPQPTQYANPNLIPIPPHRFRVSKTTAGALDEKPVPTSVEKIESLSVQRKMAPAPTAPPPTAFAAAGGSNPPGPHPSYIEIAKPYIFEQQFQEYLAAIGMTEAKEDSVRLQGIAWIDSVRRSLQLPVRTYNTAAVYYHKFRLLHADNEYSYQDAAAAALFTACKIEDTLKKSRDILCAAYNLKLSPPEHLSSDDPIFESHSKTIIGLERLMLEGASFDFRNRHPQEILIKLCKFCKLPKDTVGKTAYNMSLDLYRTFAPLKQTTATMAISCVELATRVCGEDLSLIMGENGIDYAKWHTTRAEVMETLLDFLDLYTHHRPATVIGPAHALDAFINIRITLNAEAAEAEIPRYTELRNASKTSLLHTNGFSKTPRNGSILTPISPASPATVTSRGTTSPSQPPSAIGTRGQNGTVRFMLDAARARSEQRTVDTFFKIEEEEYEVEVEIDTNNRRRGGR